MIKQRPWADDEPPLSSDDVLLQRYLDGVLDDEELLDIEQRFTEDPAFVARVESYGSLFLALDLEGARRQTAPLGIVEAAVAAWEPECASPALAALGGVRSAALWFGLADLVLGAALVGLVAAWGPARLISSWVMGIKDVALWVGATAPSPEQLLLVVPVATVACCAGLMGVFVGARRIVASAEAWR